MDQAQGTTIGQSMLRRARNYIAATADFLYPPHCAVCGEDWDRCADEPLICPTCRDELHTQNQPMCRRCAAPTAASAADAPDCPLCRGVRFRFDRATTLGVYRGVLRDVVLRMKQPAGESLSLALGKLLADRVRKDFDQIRFDFVTPVPMAWARRIVRGANSPDLLVEAVSRHLGISAARRVLRLRRNPKRQSSLPPSKRFGNVRGAYRVAKGYDLDGVNLLLMDDIMTTGATASEAAKVFKQAGAQSVSVATIARGVGEI